MERVPFLNGAAKSELAAPVTLRTKPEWHEFRRRICGFYSLFAIVAAVLVVVFFGVLAGADRGHNRHGSHATSIYNSTLGFGAIVLMSLPERTDRRDAVSLIAARSDIQITKFIEATRGEDMHPKARPFGKANATEADGYIGSWRTHMNALKYVVDNRLETALLFEDDVDWDVRIKSQLTAFSQGLRTSHLRNQTSTPISPRYPYGTDWDIMHLGAVIIKPAPRPFDKLLYQYMDEERPKDPGCWSKDPKNPMFCWSPLLDTLGIRNDSRAILPSHSVTGLPALAVTYEGALRLLWELSLNRLDYTLDWSIYDLMNRGRLRGWTVLPPLFGMWKMGGPADSDLFSFGSTLHSQTEGSSPGLERSARQELNEEYGAEMNRWTKGYWQSVGIDIGPPTAGLSPVETKKRTLRL